MSDPFCDQLLRLLPRLGRFALSLCGSQSDADDLVQAACERALKKRKQWTPDTRLDSWMFRIMHNLWIDEKRKRRPQAVAQQDLEQLAAPQDGKVDQDIKLAEVLKALEQLSDEARLVVSCVCIEGLSYAETAAVAGVPTGTVMSRLCRARKALSRSLDLEGSPWGKAMTGVSA